MFGGIWFPIDDSAPHVAAVGGARACRRTGSRQITRAPLSHDWPAAGGWLVLRGLGPGGRAASRRAATGATTCARRLTIPVRRDGRRHVASERDAGRATTARCVAGVPATSASDVGLAPAERAPSVALAVRRLIWLLFLRRLRQRDAARGPTVAAPSAATLAGLRAVRRGLPARRPADRLGAVTDPVRCLIAVRARCCSASPTAPGRRARTDWPRSSTSPSLPWVCCRCASRSAVAAFLGAAGAVAARSRCRAGADDPASLLFSIGLATVASAAFVRLIRRNAELAAGPGGARRAGGRAGAGPVRPRPARPARPLAHRDHGQGRARPPADDPRPGRAAAEVADIERLARRGAGRRAGHRRGLPRGDPGRRARLGPRRARRRGHRGRAARRARRGAGRPARAVRLGGAGGGHQRGAALRRASGCGSRCRRRRSRSSTTARAAPATVRSAAHGLDRAARAARPRSAAGSRRARSTAGGFRLFAEVPA